MVGLAWVEIVVLKDVKKGKQTAVDPSTPLLHEVLVAFHGICPCSRIGNVSQIKIALGLAVDSQGEDTVFSQVHVSLLIATHFQIWIKSEFEIRMLKKIRLVFIWFDQGSVTISGPSSRQYMKKSKSTLSVFVQKMSNDVLIFLCSLNRKKCSWNTSILLMFSISSLLRRKIRINIH